jgi:hypothetical protein
LYKVKTLNDLTVKEVITHSVTKVP